MSVRQLIPAGLADIPPGPELARVLAGLELSRLSGFDCVDVLKAQYRQANHERARVLAAMAEVGVCGLVPDNDLTRMATPNEFSADEVRAALVLTRRAAEGQFWLAHDTWCDECPRRGGSRRRVIADEDDLWITPRRS